MAIALLFCEIVTRIHGSIAVSFADMFMIAFFSHKVDLKIDEKHFQIKLMWVQVCSVPNFCTTVSTLQDYHMWFIRAPASDIVLYEG